MNQKGPSNKKKGRSKKGHVLAAAVQRATQNFVERGEEIALENPDVKDDMLAAVDEVRKTGTHKMKFSFYPLMLTIREKVCLSLN